ncbi:hypothetical protein LT336_00786 [Spiroplasma sp. JKS002671]|uniref:ABC transporter permease n=1 Tax=Spiroplasma attinicola TaxID=2904537 RepID=UPI002022B2C0|nr:ABC transporter permease [Spiroplasma sp. JKS002671]MCL8211034.1 hypothetical protein [Spiroplasma sp. JKS002671]
MPIFRYTTKKIFISPSTWVVLFLSIVILALSWSLPFVLANAQAPIKISWTKNLVLSTMLSTWKIFTFSTFISFTLIIFIGVKATQIFRDEIDDGTLLILVSKPISRNKIWREKWLSFQVTLILYVFLTILVSGLFLLIPKIGNATIYGALVPYMGILFGIALLFDLIISSIILLLSLVLNSKATIAISVGFAALIGIFSQTLEFLIPISDNYFNASHAVAVLHNLEDQLDTTEISWVKTQLTGSDYRNTIKDILERIYNENITDVDYPTRYDPIKEQTVLNDIIKNPSNYSNYSADDVTLISHIVKVSNVFRQWKQQSYEELMTSIQVGIGNGSTIIIVDDGTNVVNYSFYNLYHDINLHFSQLDVNSIKTKIFQKRMLRYFNIFYHFYYLWVGTWNDTHSLYVDDATYIGYNDPYLISFKEVSSDPATKYQVNDSSGNSKILSFPILLVVYLLIGFALLGTSWYIFNSRDFT